VNDGGNYSIESDMKKRFKIFARRNGFSLAEMLAALVISSMVLVVVLSIYSRAENVAAGVTRKLDNISLPAEVLQRIAEDLDRMAGTSSGVKITIENKTVQGLQTAKLVISTSFYNKENKEQKFEEIVWQGNYDYEAGTGLILYRSHSGITVEDKLLDNQKENWEKELFVPICSGITFFKIEACTDANLVDKWTNPSLPQGVTVTISFAEPFKLLDGTMDVPESDKISRTISVNTSRKIKFEIAEKTTGTQSDELKQPKQPQ
jgi:prepilin-type N-terminal cleavage/methylation domain-containing protein